MASMEPTLPVYQALARKIRQDIEAGAYAEREFLPGMDALAAKYKVARMTIHKAIKELEHQGLVRPQRGRGTEIMHRPRRRERGEPRGEARDPKANFEAWKVLVEVEGSFPRLKQIAFKDLALNKNLYLRRTHTSQLRGVIRAVAAGPGLQPYIVVSMARGHGCTTLFRLVHRMLTEEDDSSGDSLYPPWGLGSKVIPIRVTWSRLGPVPDQFHKHLEAAIRLDLLRELTRDTWQEMVQPAQFAKLLDAVQDPQPAALAGTGPSSSDEPRGPTRALASSSRALTPASRSSRTSLVDEHRQRIRALLPVEDPNNSHLPPAVLADDQLHKLAPYVADTPIPELISHLTSKKVGLRVLLMFDLSQNGIHFDDYSRHVDYLVGLIKDLHEMQIHALAGPSDPLFSELYFLDHYTYDLIRAVFDRAPKKFAFPHFAKADIFGILARHYPAVVHLMAAAHDIHRLVTMTVPAVIHSSILDELEVTLAKEGYSFTDLSLEEIIARLEQTILDKMRDEWDFLSYHLYSAIDPGSIPTFRRSPSRFRSRSHVKSD